MAKIVPGKEEFYETIRYFQKQLDLLRVDMRLGKAAAVADLINFDSVVIATGVTPRKVQMKNNCKEGGVTVLSYIDVLRHKKPVGSKVAIIGAGGIGFDVADFLTHSSESSHSSLPGPEPKVNKDLVDEFLSSWGVDAAVSNPGGLLPAAKEMTPPRTVYLLQRKGGKVGAGLGKTTGWIHRAVLKKRNVIDMSGCSYVEINDSGLVIERDAVKSTLDVDTIVVCAGQVSLNDLVEPLQKAGKKVFSIGGALRAGELDAKRAIDQGTRLAAVIESAKSGEIFDAPVDLMPRVMKTVEGFIGKKG